MRQQHRAQLAGSCGLLLHGLRDRTRASGHRPRSQPILSRTSATSRTTCNELRDWESRCERAREYAGARALMGNHPWIIGQPIPASMLA
jgi:hypothetical protein